jgi:hypothetical protein
VAIEGDGAERLEKEFDVLSAPHLNHMFDDNLSEVRVCIKNKINIHVLEAGRVEFRPVD